MLEKEVSKLEVQLLQSRQIEGDLREKCENLRQKNDALQLDLFKANDGERKSGIELQIKVNQLQQELDLKEAHYQKQHLEDQQKLQDAVLEKEKRQLELTQVQERSKHELEMQKERAELELQKTKGSLERNLLTASERDKEQAMQIDQLRDKVEKLMHSLQEVTH